MPARIKRERSVAWVSVAVVLWAATSASANLITWNGAAGADWNAAGNWLPNTAVPGINDEAYFSGTGKAVTILANPASAVDKVTVAGTGIWTLGSAGTTLTVNTLFSHTSTGADSYGNGIRSVLAGPGALSVTAGTLTLAAATGNTYQGGTTINGGTVMSETVTGNPFGTGTIHLISGTFTAHNGAPVITSPVSVEGNFTLANVNVPYRFDTGAWTLTGNRTLTAASSLSNMNSATINSAIGGNFKLTKDGTGQLVLGGASTFNGFELQAGHLRIAGSGSTVGGGGAITGPLGSGTVRFTGGNLDGDNAVVTRTIHNPIEIAGSFGLNTEGTYSKGNLILAGNATLLADGYQITVGGGNGGAYTTTFSGAIGDGGLGYGFTKLGAGTLIFGGANSYTGPTNVNLGTLSFNNVAQFGTNALALNGGSLAYTGPAATLNAALTMTAAASLNITNKLTLPNDLTLNGNLTLNGIGELASTAPTGLIVPAGVTQSLIINNSTTRAQVSAPIQVGSGSTLTIDTSSGLNASYSYSSAGVISGAGNVVAKPLSDKRLTLNAANTFTGDLISTQGGLSFSGQSVNPGDPGAFGAGMNSAVKIMGGNGVGGTLENATISLLNSTWHPFEIYNNASMYTGNYTGQVTLFNNATLTAGSTAGSSSMAATGAIGGIGSVILACPGQGGFDRHTFIGGSASNTYSGLTTANSANVRLGKTGGAIAVPHDLLVNATGTYSPIVYLFGNEQIADSGVVSFGSTTGGYPILDLYGSSETVAGLADYLTPTSKGIIDNSSTTANSTLTVSPGIGISNAFPGVLRNTGTGTLALVKAGDGTQMLSGITTHTGGTTVSAGTLVIGRTVRDQLSGAANSATAYITVVGHNLANGDPVLFTATTVPTGLSANVIYYARNISGNTFQVSATPTGAAINFTANGAGLVGHFGPLSGASTPALVVNGGTLSLPAGVSYNRPITFTSGELAGSGTFNTPLSFGAGQSMAPGASPDAVTTAATTWAAGGTYLWEMNDVDAGAGLDPGWDLWNMGSLTVTAASGSPFILKLISLNTGNTAGPVADFDNTQTYTWKIASSATDVVGFSPDLFAFDTTQFTNDLGAGAFAVQLNANNRDIELVFAQVPEPATMAFLALGGLCMAGSAIRRRHRRVA
ncbi:MAG: autotransporter-associated beta strand repeat-containing protein [Phycisphaerae bacterium]|nr:autotransporter-associated beta strand repeat-containing protein [Phycisphaerae bacterium]